VNRIEAIQSAFCCPKCKGRAANVNHARLRLSGGPFPLKAGRFFVVTCTLCGYTEFYDQSAYADDRETIEENASAPAKPVTGQFPP